jgi:hypothetical protein
VVVAGGSAVIDMIDAVGDEGRAAAVGGEDGEADRVDESAWEVAEAEVESVTTTSVPTPVGGIGSASAVAVL